MVIMYVSQFTMHLYHICDQTFYRICVLFMIIGLDTNAAKKLIKLFWQWICIHCRNTKVCPSTRIYICW